MKLFLTAFLFCLSLVANAQDEATQSEIRTKGGLVYKNNVLFTGTLYNDNANYLMLEANYKNGKLNGVKREWYKNGKLKFESNYNNGKLNGQKKECFSNGEIKSIKQYVNGKPEGKHISYNINGKVEKEELYSNGKVIKTKKANSEINNLDAFAYLFKIYKPDNYSTQFLEYFLSLTDVNKYNSYRNNEFELRRKMAIAEQKIKNRIDELNFKNIYIFNGTTNLGTYSFEQKKYSIKIGKINKGLTIANWNGGMTSNGQTFSQNSPKIRFVNKNMFETIDLSLSHSEAEILKNKIKYNLYYSFEYKIILPMERFNSQFLTNYLDAYVLRINFYSDRNRNNFVYSIDKSKDINKFITNLKAKKETKHFTTSTKETTKNEDYPLIKGYSKKNGKKLSYQLNSYSFKLEHGVVAVVEYNQNEKLINKVTFRYFDGQNYNLMYDSNGDGKIDRYIQKNTNLPFESFMHISIEDIKSNPKLLATKGFGGSTYTYMVDFSQSNGIEKMTIIKGLDVEEVSNSNRISNMINLILRRFYLNPKTNSNNVIRRNKSNNSRNNSKARSNYRGHKPKKHNPNKSKPENSYNNAYKRANEMYNKGYKKANEMYKKGRLK